MTENGELDGSQLEAALTPLAEATQSRIALGELVQKAVDHVWSTELPALQLEAALARLAEATQSRVALEEFVERAVEEVWSAKLAALPPVPRGMFRVDEVYKIGGVGTVVTGYAGTPTDAGRWQTGKLILRDGTVHAYEVDTDGTTHRSENGFAALHIKKCSFGDVAGGDVLRFIGKDA